MNEFKILVDSTSDISPQDQEAYEIDYLHMSYYLKGQIYDASLSWKEITPDEYYSMMKEGYRSLTGQASLNEISSKFESLLSKGYDILYIGCSSMLSGTINNARIIACDFIDKYPHNQIVIMDSLRSNYSQAMMAIQASKMKKENKSLGETVSYLFQERLKYQTYGLLDSLEWIKKAGRVKKTYKVKNILGYKFLVYSDADGYNTLFDSCMSKKSGLSQLADIVKERIEEKHDIYIEHASCLSNAELLKEYLLERGIKEEIHILDMGPIIGATTGPDSLTVSFYGKKVTNLE